MFNYQAIAAIPIVISAYTVSADESTTHRKLLDAIAIVESNNNSNAVGDGGDSIGCYQISYAYWYDATEHDPSIGGDYQDCFDKAYAEKIVLAYWDRYGGDNPTDEKLSKIHNGGPNGHKKAATAAYWEKVRQELEKGK